MMSLVSTPVVAARVTAKKHAVRKTTIASATNTPESSSVAQKAVAATIALSFIAQPAFADDAADKKAKAAALKAKRDAETEEKKKIAMERLAKKEAKQRSLCNLEVKPWEEEQDLMELFAKIKSTVVKDGLQWGENCELKPVAYGIKKICMTAVISQSVSMDEVT